MKKILILTPRLSDGGIEKVASNLSIGMSNVKHNVLALYRTENARYDFSTTSDVLDVRIRSGIFGKILSTVERVLNVRKYIKENNIDVVVSMGETCNIIAMLSGIKLKKILTIHSQLSIESKTKGKFGIIQIIVAKFLYRYAQHIIAVSHVVKEDAEKLLKVNNISVIYNGHDLNAIRKKSDLDDNLAKKSDAIIVGRITFAKGHWFLLRALSKVKQELPEFRLTILGSIEDKEIYTKLLDMVEHFDLGSNIEFVKYTDNPYPYIKNSKFLVQSSVYEGFPGVVIEALSLGVPVLTTNCGGATELITNGLVPSKLSASVYIGDLGVVSKHMGTDILDYQELTGSEIEFSNSIIKMMNRNFDKTLLSSTSEKFSLKVMAERYMGIINDI